MTSEMKSYLIECLHLPSISSPPVYSSLLAGPLLLLNTLPQLLGPLNASLLDVSAD